ncbi:hypothetical protein KY334_07720 [Candidatus Woesearchaeota archaeon]|nr:hypothetical protein [Candidatus Woesearchaeota archaeon]
MTEEKNLEKKIEKKRNFFLDFSMEDVNAEKSNYLYTMSFIKQVINSLKNDYDDFMLYSRQSLTKKSIEELDFEFKTKNLDLYQKLNMELARHFREGWFNLNDLDSLKETFDNFNVTYLVSHHEKLKWNGILTKLVHQNRALYFHSGNYGNDHLVARLLPNGWQKVDGIYVNTEKFDEKIILLNCYSQDLLATESSSIAEPLEEDMFTRKILENHDFVPVTSEEQLSNYGTATNREIINVKSNDVVIWRPLSQIREFASIIYGKNPLDRKFEFC